jgi:hypothetical protein
MPVLERQIEPAVQDAPPEVLPASSTPRPSRRRSASTYEQLLTKAAFVLALAIIAGVWWAGAYATIVWLGNLGVAVDAAGAAAWVLPLSVTVIESGTLAARSRLPWLWAVWVAVLAFDVVTTASGLLSVAAGRPVFDHLMTTSDPTSQALASVAGLVIALAPEPAGRAIWHELWS